MQVEEDAGGFGSRILMEKHLALLSLWASAFNNVGCIARDLSADLFGGRFWVEEG